jgi:hypothetical protein
MKDDLHGFLLFWVVGEPVAWLEPGEILGLDRMGFVDRSDEVAGQRADPGGQGLRVVQNFLKTAVGKNGPNRFRGDGLSGNPLRASPSQKGIFMIIAAIEF